MITHIVDDIYIGNWQDARDIKDRCEIFTVAKDSPFIGKHYYALIDGEDPCNETILGHSILDLIKLRRKTDECILVHCVSGYSRSSAVVVGYIMEVHKLSLSESYKYVQLVRPQANINPALLQLLHQLEHNK